MVNFIKEEMLTEEDRKSREAEFHDNLYTSSSKKGQRISFYNEEFFEPLQDCAFSYLGDLNGKKILFYGCGLQWSIASIFYKRDANVHMIDISHAAIETLERKIHKENQMDRIKPIQMDCEHLDFPESSFDLVFGQAIIHHLDTSKSVNELFRVMKQGARGAFIEPLGMNPFINFYRKLTPNQRTHDEHPLSLTDFEVIGNKFSYFKHIDFTLSALIPVAWNAVAERLGLFPIRSKSFRKFDSYVIGKVPSIGKYCWNTVIHIEK